MEVEAIARSWGNSLGVILPKSTVDAFGIKENDKVVIQIKKKHLAKEFFGMFSDWKTPTDKIKKEMKKGW